MSDSRRAAMQAARTRVKRAQGLLREAARDLAIATDGDTPLGNTRVHNDQTRQAALDLIGVGVARYGAVDVIVIARPLRPGHPSKAPHGAPSKEL